MSGNVVPHPATISLVGEGISALENERGALYAKAMQLTKDQQEIMLVAMDNVASISKQHEAIIEHIGKLDDAIRNLIIGATKP